jgi:hypothetical protein
MKHFSFKTPVLPVFLFTGIMFLSTQCAQKHSDTGTSPSSMYAPGNEPLFMIPEGVETRWASAENFKGEKGLGGQANEGRKGSPCITPLKAGETRVLAQAGNTSGMVRRIWVTISDRSPQMVRSLRLDMYWDGAEKPAVSAPIGDFFSQGLGNMVTFQSALFSNPEGRSFNCYIPMPFLKGMKITVTNESGKDLDAFFYDVDYTIGEHLPSGILYFHAYFHRENPTVEKQDFEILPKVHGKGRYLGCNIGVIADQKKYDKKWWGEGEVKAYIDGDDQYPTLCGTGTEDYIGTGWGEGRYDNLYQGCILADGDKYHYCFYRLHIPDPVYFQTDARVTIQQIGWSDKGLFERQDDWSSCVWFYLDKPTDELPALAPVAERTAGLE